MYEIMVGLTASLMLASAVHYVVCTWRRTAKPVLSTWIIMFIMMALTLGMYLTSPRNSLGENIAVSSGMVNITIILIGVVVVGIRDRTLAVSFDRVQKWCLGLTGVIVVFWYFSRDPMTAYVLVQVLGIVGYVATVKKLMKVKRTTEPVFVWLAVLMATICAIYPALVMHNVFARVYLIRALPSTLIMTTIILRLKWRARKMERAS